MFKNFKPSIHRSVSTESDFAKKKKKKKRKKERWLSMCLLVVLVWQGIVVKCTAAILFSPYGGFSISTRL